LCFNGKPVPVMPDEITKKDLSEDELKLLTAWMKSDDPALQKHRWSETHIVEGAIRQHHIAKDKYGKKTVDARNTALKQEQERLRTLAKGSREAAEVFRARKSAIFVPELKHLQAPHLTWQQTAQVCEYNAGLLEAFAREMGYDYIDTKRQGGDSWRQNQFMRGMVGVIEGGGFVNWDGEEDRKLEEPDYKLVAALTNLAFNETKYTSDHVKDALNTTKDSRSRKHLKPRHHTRRKKLKRV
jgi:hypothetical protein